MNTVDDKMRHNKEVITTGTREAVPPGAGAGV